METGLKENERIDDLERNGYRIIQNKRRFCFGMDAVLLSGFACDTERGAGTDLRIADLGTGTGIIPLLLHGKLCCSSMKLCETVKNAELPDYGLSESGTGQKSCLEEADRILPETGNRFLPKGFSDNLPQKKHTDQRIIGLEIQEEMADMARRSVALNDLEQEIRIVTGDLKRASELLGRGCFDVVTSNPPYKKHGGGISNPDLSKAVSRHEILCTFEDVAREAAALLKNGGRFYLVHRPERLAELIGTMKEYRLEPKRLRMVHSFADSEAVMVLMEAVRGGRSFLKVERPVIIYREKGIYTEEIRKIYSF